MTHFNFVSSQENNVHCTQTLFLKSRWSGNVKFGGKQLARDKVIRENFRQFLCIKELQQSWK